MYHEEKIIDGVLCHRGLPNDDWTPYTAAQLTARLQQMSKALKDASYWQVPP